LNENLNNLLILGHNKYYKQYVDVFWPNSNRIVLFVVLWENFFQWSVWKHWW